MLMGTVQKLALLPFTGHRKRPHLSSQIPTMCNLHHNEKNNVEVATTFAALTISHTWRQKINLLILLCGSFSCCSMSKGWVLAADFLGDVMC